MAGTKVVQMKTDKPVAGVTTGISAALVHTDRGIPNQYYLATGFGQWVNEFGYYIGDSSANYQTRAAFNNGARSIYGIRLVGPDAKCAMGAEDTKVAESKAQLTHGAAAAQLNLLSVARGVDGALVNLVITTSATDDVTSVSLANSYDISLVLAQTSDWKRCAKVASYVLNGYAHFISGTVANDSVCWYAFTPGTGGNSYNVEIKDSGGGGPATYTFSADGYTLTIDLKGVAVTATAAVAAVNALAKGIRGFVVGTGASNIAVTALSPLAGGQSDVAALAVASFGSTGLTTVTNMARTFLAGKGAVLLSGDTFADANTLDPLTLVTSKVIPGDIFVVLNGANEGAYEITEVNAQTGLTIDGTWSASQSNVLYAIYGSDAAYGHVAMETLSPGDRGDEMYLEIKKETGGATLKASLKVLDGDGVTRTLEEFTKLSPVYGSDSYIDTKIAAESRWIRLHTFPEKIKCANTDGATTAGDPTLTSATSTFVDDEVAVGDFVVVTSSTTPADIRVYEVIEVTDQTHLELSENFGGLAAAVEFTVVGSDTTGAALLALVGATGITITMAGGVNDEPTRDQYLGNSGLMTGVYQIDKIPVMSRPNKFWCPDGPTVVDGSGVDATDAVNAAMITFADNSVATAKGIAYLFSAEFGLTPTTLLADVASDGIDSVRVAEYWPWVRMSDPVSGSYKWVPVTGHMIGVYDSADSGSEGMHAAPANVVLQDVAAPPNTSCLEYEVNDTEYELLVEANINPIIRLSGYRPYGARARTSDSEYVQIQKTLVLDRTVRSIVQSLKTWLPFGVQSRSTWGKVRKAIDGYMSKYDRRIVSNGAFENYKDVSLKPWYVTCDESNNDMASNKVIIEMGVCVVGFIEEIVLRYGLWDGGVEVEEV